MRQKKAQLAKTPSSDLCKATNAEYKSKFLGRVWRNNDKNVDADVEFFDEEEEEGMVKKEW